MNLYQIRVDHDFGFFSFYDLVGLDADDVKKRAEQLFTDDFCGGRKYALKSTIISNTVLTDSELKKKIREIKKRIGNRIKGN